MMIAENIGGSQLVSVPILTQAPLEGKALINVASLVFLVLGAECEDSW